MKLSASRSALKFILSLCVVVLATPLVYAGIGFQAVLNNPTRVVTYYDEISYLFSAALQPKTYPLLSPNLNFSGRLDGGDFKNSSLRFKTEYRPGYSLVPSAVDAEQYLEYRVAKGTTDRLMDVVRRARFEQKQDVNRTGLNLGVALPKRLDRIFGEGGGNLKVTGYRRISFSGRSQWSDAANTDLYRQSKFPALNMEQTYQFGIEGTIGTKISVKVTEDSQTDIPLSNRLIIRYKGDDDDILKAVEAGNTTLDLPNTEFVGYSGQIHGLFGFKTVAKVGRLSLTGIMSQEKGSSERATVSAGGEQNAQYIRDYANAEGRIFDLGEKLGSGGFSPDDIIYYIKVYERLPGTGTIKTPDKARFYLNPLDTTDHRVMEPAAQEEPCPVQEVDTSRYEFRDEIAGNKHYIVFRSAQTNAFGVYLRVQRLTPGPDSGKIVTVGDISTNSKILKLIYPSSDYSPTNPTWGYMWRNCYNVPTNASIADLDLKVFKGLPSTEGTPSSLDYQKSTTGQSQGKYLRILGLDQYRGNGVRTPDDKADDRREIYNDRWGLLIFPSRTPFYTDTSFTDTNGIPTATLIQKVPNIYTYTSPTDKSQNSQYYIQLSSKTRGAVIRLNKVNIIEGSDRVTANGTPLTRGTDYSVDYNFGSVTLLSAKALDPNAVVNVDFEYAPFLSMQKKTLLGMRAEYEWSDDFKFGGTILYKSDKAQDRKPRVGQETAEMLVMDFDTRFKITPSFLTKAVNALPFITTEAPSPINFSAEVAQSRPNPNVDNAAYIDDFESTVEQLSLGMTRTNWTQAPPPKKLGPNYWRAKMLWHNPLGGVNVKDVYNRDVASGEGTINTLRMIYRPDDTTEWGGILTYFASRIDTKRAHLFEIRLRGRRGILHFDFGKIDERLDPLHDNRYIQTEDRDQLGRIDESEDTGLDGVVDSAEFTYHRDGSKTGYDRVTNPDPSGDNWYFQGQGKCPVSDCGDTLFQRMIGDQNSPIFYDYLNGTEGNLKDPAVIGKPDQQRLGPTLNTRNCYFTYRIDLARDPSVPNSDVNDWRTYRISLRDSAAVDDRVSDDSTRPDWSQVTHVRVWMENPPGSPVETDTVEVAAWYFVQSNWADSLVSKQSKTTSDPARFYAASVSTEDRTFSKPPAVPDVIDPNTQVAEPQRGLALAYSNFRPGDTGLVAKKLIAVDKYTGYRRLKMYVHGDTSWIAGGTTPVLQPMFFFRLGKDSVNYYEYRTHLSPGWADGNEVDIDFNEMTALKVSANKETSKYRVRGSPSIDQVAYLAAGVTRDDADSAQLVGQPTISGQVWLDELRVTDVRRDRGSAGRVHVDGSLADLISYSASWRRKDPYFRGVSTATRGGGMDNLGSGATETAYDYSVSLSLDRFLPRSWTPRLPVSYSYSNNTRIPLLRTGSDIILPPSASDSEKIVAETHSFSINEGFSRKGKNPLFNLLLNRQTATFSYGRNINRSATSPFNFSENYTVNGTFDMAVQKPPTVPIFFWTKPIPILNRTAKSKLGLYPTTWQWSGQFTRTLSVSQDINNNIVSSYTRGLNLQTNLNYKVFDNLSSTYSYQTVRDVTDPQLVTLSLQKLRLGLETSYSQNFSSTYDPKLLSFLTSSFQYTSTYTDRYERSTDSRSGSLSSSWSVAGTFKHLALLGSPPTQSASVGSGRRYMDTTTAVTKKVSWHFYDYPLSALRFLTGWIQPIGYRYSTGYTNSLFGMKDRPDFGYRFGLYRVTNVPTVRASQTPSSGETVNYEFTSGFGLMGGLSTDVRYRMAIARDLVKQGNRLESRTIGWPDLTIRISRFTTFPFVKDLVNKFITVFAPQTAFTRQTKEQRDLTAGVLMSRSISVDRSPLLSVTFRAFSALSLTGSYATGSSTDYRYSQTTGELQSEARSSHTALTVTARYSFSAPGGLRIPLLHKIKFKSEMTFDLTVSKKTNYGEVRLVGEDFKKNTDNSEFTVTPVIGYSFSRTLKGGLQGSWQDNSDNFAQRRTHARQLQIWLEFRF